MKCSDCRFYSVNVSSISTAKYQDGIGECRRHAPRGPLVLGWTTPSAGGDDIVITHRPIVSPYPFVPNDDWCGEFSPSGK